MLTVEKLMEPRYVVIALWPHNTWFKIGDILELEGNGYLTYNTFGKNSNEFDAKWISNPERYPANLRLLNWWEDRKPDEMPAYIKLNPKNTTGDMVFRMLGYKPFPNDVGVTYLEYIKGVTSVNSLGVQRTNNCCYFLPATEDEYLNYLN